MTDMFDTLIKAFRQPELKKKILYTLLILGLYMLGGLVPVPGINAAAFTNLVQNWGQIGAMMETAIKRIAKNTRIPTRIPRGRLGTFPETLAAFA